MQMSYGLYRRFLVDLANLKESVVNAIQVVSFMRKKRHFQPSVFRKKVYCRYSKNILPFNLCRKNELVNTKFYASRKRTIMTMCRMNG